MSVIIISAIAASSLGIFFSFLSIFTRKQDYMLDDYTQEDKPDNVRIIERDVLKIIEKEVEIENTVEIDRLKVEIEDIISDKDSLDKKLQNKEHELDTLYTKLNDYKQESVHTIESLEKEESILRDKLDEITIEHRTVTKELNKLSIELRDCNRELQDKVDELEQLTSDKDNLDKIVVQNQVAIEELNNSNKSLQAHNKKLQSRIIETEDENKIISTRLVEESNQNDKIIEDRDYFIKLLEKKENEIKAIKHDINYEYQKHPNVYEGVDEYGRFYDITRIDNKFPKEHVNKIRNVSDEIDPDQFAYYGINTSNGYENIEIHGIKTLQQFVDRVKDKKTKGKYRVYIILDIRVYYYDVH